MYTTTQRVRDQLLIALAAIALLYLGRSVLVPLAYSLLTAMVLSPYVARMERRGMPRAVAITVGLLAVTALFTAIGSLLLWELSAFLRQLPELGERTQGGLGMVRERVNEIFGPVTAGQGDRFTAMMSGLPDRLGPLFIWSANAVFGMVFNLLMIPIFTALLLADRHALVQAVAAVVGPSMRAHMPSILRRCVGRFASFILGMVKVYLIVGVLNSIGLLLLGVPNAILFGMLSALMTIIPYVGIIISSLLPISVAWMTTGELWAPLGVVGVFAIVQYLEANIIFPRVVGAQLGLNTLSSMLIVLVGALLWGVSGMVLLLPYVSILMIISEDIPAWRALPMILGKARKRGEGS